MSSFSKCTEEVLLLDSKDGAARTTSRAQELVVINHVTLSYSINEKRQTRRDENRTNRDPSKSRRYHDTTCSVFLN